MSQGQSECGSEKCQKVSHVSLCAIGSKSRITFDYFDTKQKLCVVVSVKY